MAGGFAELVENLHSTASGAVCVTLSICTFVGSALGEFKPSPTSHVTQATQLHVPDVTVVTSMVTITVPSFITGTFLGLKPPVSTLPRGRG